MRQLSGRSSGPSCVVNLRHQSRLSTYGSRCVIVALAGIVEENEARRHCQDCLNGLCGQVWEVPQTASKTNQPQEARTSRPEDDYSRDLVTTTRVETLIREGDAPHSWEILLFPTPEDIEKLRRTSSRKERRDKSRSGRNEWSPEAKYDGSQKERRGSMKRWRSLSSKLAVRRILLDVCLKSHVGFRRRKHRVHRWWYVHDFRGEGAGRKRRVEGLLIFQTLVCKLIYVVFVFFFVKYFYVSFFWYFGEFVAD